MLYEHNSSIEPTSSTLLLQRTPSESGSYTTDEYSYRRTNGSKQQLKNQTTIERNKKKSKKSNYNNGGTLGSSSKSSTASSHISEHSKVSNIQQMPNKPTMFLLNELPPTTLQPVSQHDQDSPPSPAPNPFNQATSSQRMFAMNQLPNSNYNAYESAYDANLYGGINRVQLSNRQHHTLNTRQLNNQQRKNQQRPVHNRVLDFIELNSELNGSSNHTMNLISNPLHHNNSLQGSMPSLVANNGQDSNSQSASNTQSSMMKKMLINNKINRTQLHPDSNLNSSLNRSSSSLVSESDNFYCDIDEAHRVQTEFRAKMNANQLMKNGKPNRYLNSGDQESGDENGDDLVSENDKLISRNENKLIVRHRRMQDEEDDLLTDQYSDYECIDRVQPNNSNRFTNSTNTANRYMRQPAQMNKLMFNNNFNTTNYNQQRLTPVNLINSNGNPSSLNESRQFNSNNLSLANKNQLSTNQFSNSQPGLFRVFGKDNGAFNTMQNNLNNRMR